MRTLEVTPDTAVLVDGEVETTLGEFFAENADGFDADEKDEILDCLRHGAQYVGGGGAAATFTVELV